MARAPRPSLNSLMTNAQRWLAASEASNSGRGSGLARAQALVFVHLDEGGTRPAEIARRSGISRQAVGQTVAKMREGEEGAIPIPMRPKRSGNPFPICFQVAPPSVDL